MPPIMPIGTPSHMARVAELIRASGSIWGMVMMVPQNKSLFSATRLQSQP